MKPPTLNSSGCDCEWASCVFGGLLFFVLFVTELYDRSLHELEYRWRLSHPLSAGGVGRVALSLCSCPDSFQNRTLHSVGAAQLLSLHLNGPLMTTTFCSTRWGHGGELRRWGRCALDFWNGGWLRKGVRGHPTHKAETAMSEEMPGEVGVGGGWLGGADFFEEELGLMGGKSLESRGLERGRAMEMSPFHTNASKWWIVAHKYAVSSGQNVFTMNFRPTRTPEDHAILQLMHLVLKLVPLFH